MARTYIAVVVMSLSVLSGCTAPPTMPEQVRDIPRAESFEAASIKKAKSAQHWDLIAKDTAEQIAAFKGGSVSGKMTYVVSSTNIDPFSRAFGTLLISRLVNLGVAVATKPDDAIKITYETQVIRHLDRRSTYSFLPQSSFSLGNGITVARYFDDHDFAAARAEGKMRSEMPNALPASPEVALKQTSTEVIVTTSLQNDKQYLMRRTNVYYVEDAEQGMFEIPSNRSATKDMQVTGQ